MKQTSFFAKPKIEFGGALKNKGRRKTERTLDSQKPMHFVLHSKKLFVLFKQKKKLQSVLKKQVSTFGVKIYSETVQRDHWHISLRITNRRLYRGFIRALTGVIARQLGKGLWRLSPYS